MTSVELERVLRWESSGGTWLVRGRTSDRVDIDLLTCDGGEVMDTISSTASDLLAHVGGRPRAG